MVGKIGPGAKLEDRLRRAELLLRFARTGLARTELEAIARATPGDARAHVILGWLAFAGGDLVAARGHVERATSGAHRERRFHDLLLVVSFNEVLQLVQT